jgi:ATP-binding cassette subfamily B protein
MHKNKKKFFFQKYFEFLEKKFYYQLLILLLMVVLYTLLSLKIPLYIRDLLNTINQNKFSETEVLFSIVFSIITLKIIVWALLRVREFWMSVLMVRASSVLRNKSFEYILGHSHNFFSDYFSGSIVKKVNDYSNSFQGIIFQLESVIIPLLIQVVGSSIIVFNINKKIGISLIIGFTFIILYNVLLSIFKMKYDKLASDSMSKVTGFTSDSISSNNTILVFSALDYEVSLRELREKEWRKNKLRQWLFGDTIYTIQGILFIILEFFILKYSVLYWSQGLITAGEFVVFQLYIIGSLTYLNSLAFSIRMIYESYADAREMIDMLNIPHEIKDSENARDLVVDSGFIEFKNVGFKYNKSIEVIKDLNININPGEKIGLVGHSGAGKSTFVKLILRFFDVTSGGIFIDKQNIKDVKKDSLYNNIGFVPQEPILFHRSLYENILYGRRDATYDEVVEASKKAHAHEFILNLPMGYDTLVGERGVKLSGGERQRIAIARAILKNAPILVLDEATSALDSESEKVIQDSLRVLMEGKTVIVIAHRLSTIQHMDRIVVMDEGFVVEDGSHNDLLKKEDSIYKKLWELQKGGFIEE